MEAVSCCFQDVCCLVVPTVLFQCAPLGGRNGQAAEANCLLMLSVRVWYFHFTGLIYATLRYSSCHSVHSTHPA
jgi:hypothetical protein